MEAEEARSVNDIRGARAGLAREFTLHADVPRSGLARRIEFYFHSVKVVAPVLSLTLDAGRPSPAHRAYQTYTVFLILIRPPFHDHVVSTERSFVPLEGTLCLQTRPILFPFLIGSPTKPDPVHAVEFPFSFSSSSRFPPCSLYEWTSLFINCSQDARPIKLAFLSRSLSSNACINSCVLRRKRREPRVRTLTGGIRSRSGERG